MFMLRIMNARSYFLVKILFICLTYLDTMAIVKGVRGTRSEPH